MSRKGEAEPHDQHRAPRLAKPCRDAQGCVEIHRKLPPTPGILLPPASTQGVTWKSSLMSHVGSRGQLPSRQRHCLCRQHPGRAGSSHVGLFFYSLQKTVHRLVACNMSLAFGNEGQINDWLRSFLTWDGFYFNGSSTCGTRAHVTLCCCFNLIVSQTEILRGFVFSKCRTSLRLSPQVPLPHVCLHGLGITPAAFGVKALPDTFSLDVILAAATPAPRMLFGPYGLLPFPDCQSSFNSLSSASRHSQRDEPRGLGGGAGAAAAGEKGRGETRGDKAPSPTSLCCS